MIEATSDRKEAEIEQQERNRMRFIAFLKESFLAADVDGNGVLDKEEFTALLEKDFVHTQMRALGIHISQEELFNAWDTLDYDESGELTIDAFVDGLSFLQEGLDTKHVVNCEYSLRRVHHKVTKEISKVKIRLDDVAKQNAEIAKKLKAQGEAQHQQQLSFWLWQQWAQRNNAYKSHLNMQEMVKTKSRTGQSVFLSEKSHT